MAPLILPENLPWESVRPTQERSTPPQTWQVMGNGEKILTGTGERSTRWLEEARACRARGSDFFRRLFPRRP